MVGLYVRILFHWMHPSRTFRVEVGLSPNLYSVPNGTKFLPFFNSKLKIQHENDCAILRVHNKEIWDEVRVVKRSMASFNSLIKTTDSGRYDEIPVEGGRFF